MLTPKEIRQLSNKDLLQSLTRARDALFQQKIGVKTTHLKDSHKIPLIKKYIARLLTENTARQKSGRNITESTSEISQKLKILHANLVTKPKVKVKKKPTTSAQTANESSAESATPQTSSAKVRVKKVAEEKPLLKKIFNK